jgi:formylglycine-generating enzyme required for sulfatase activity
MVVAAALVLVVPTTLTITVEGQGGDPRNLKPSSTPKKSGTTNKSATSAKRKPAQSGSNTGAKPADADTNPASKSTSSTPPPFRPQNPNIELVRIPAGSFMMGSPNDAKPVHQVMINYSFYMGRFEVTQTQWELVMGKKTSYFNDCGNCPVEQVSWDDAQSFIQSLNQINDGHTYRLPTEAEWEYACRAGTTGDYAGDLDSMAWYEKNSAGRTHVVGSKQPNAWGLSDMHGNVWEWCEDVFHLNYKGAPTDGSAWLSVDFIIGRAMRGGAWHNNAAVLRSASSRSFSTTYSRESTVGFRVVAVR